MPVGAAAPGQLISATRAAVDAPPSSPTKVVAAATAPDVSTSGFSSSSLRLAAPVSTSRLQDGSSLGGPAGLNSGP
jgi:hypothetical protein